MRQAFRDKQVEIAFYVHTSGRGMFDHDYAHWFFLKLFISTFSKVFDGYSDDIVFVA